MQIKRNPAAAAVVLSLVLAWSGCAGYQLGSTLPPGIESVYVPTFVNNTREPQIETDTTRAAIEEFQRDGTLRVVGRDRADTMVEVTLTGFALEPLRYDRNRALQTEEYRLRITAEIVFKRLGPEETVMLQKTVEGSTEFDFTGDLSSSKRTALPDAADDLAHEIVESVVEYW